MTRRRYLTAKRKAALWHDQDERCAECRAPLVLAISDHMNPLWCTGDNAADNWQLLCISCHDAKTKREAAARAKTKRLENIRLHGTKKRRGRQMPSRPFGPGRGFDTRLRKRMSGRVEVRT